MSTANRQSLNYTTWSVLPAVVIATILGLVLAGPGLLVAGLFTLPWLAWRYDNDSGTFLVLAVLFLLVLTILSLLLFLMAVAH